MFSVALSDSWLFISKVAYRATLEAYRAMYSMIRNKNKNT